MIRPIRLRLTVCVLAVLVASLAAADKPTQITLDPLSMSLTVGESKPIDAEGAVKSWSSSDATVAILLSPGLVKAVGVGTAVITAKNGPYIAQTVVTVTEPPPPPPPPPCAFAVTPPSFDFPSGGGIGSVAVATQDGCDWTAASNQAWAPVTPTGVTGGGSVSVTVAANTATDDRVATLSVAGQSVSVTQSGVPPPPLPPPAPTYGPQSTQTRPAGSVLVSPGATTIHAAVAANPGATTFWLTAGTYLLSSTVVPKSGNTFIGEYGAILDGGNVSIYAFYSNNLHQTDVTIKNLEIRNFVTVTSPASFGAITGNDVTNWIVMNNAIHHNLQSGLLAGPGTGWQVKWNSVYANSKSGIQGYKCHGGVFENNELYGNNPTNGGGGVEAGIKVLGTSNLVIRNNYSHNNGGVGLWSDTNLSTVLIEGNTVDDNTRVGIWHEISYAAIIRNNTVRRNGVNVVGGWLVGVVGIAVSNSKNVEIYGNTVLDNRGGITGMMVETGYPDGAEGHNILENLYVHDNLVRFPAGATGKNGIDSSTGASLEWYTTRNNRYENNDYIVPSLTGQWFAWQEAFKTWAQWQAYGHDLTGSIAVQ